MCHQDVYMALGAVITHLHFRVYLVGSTKCHNYMLFILVHTVAILQLLIEKSVILGLRKSVKACDHLQE